AYSPKSQDSPGHPVKFMESLAEMGKNTVIHITAFFHIVIVVTKSLQKIEQQSKGVLSHRFCGVSGYVSPLDSPKSQVIFIQIVGACGSDADQFQVLGSGDGAFIDQNLINYKYVCVLNTPGNFFGRAERISYHFSKLLKG